MTQEVSDFIPGSLEDTDKHIEVLYKHHITVEKNITSINKMCDNNKDLFIATLQKLFLSLDLCARLFYIITIMNLGQTCLLHKGFFTVYFGEKVKMQLHYHIVHKGKHAFWGKSTKCHRQRNYHPEIKLLCNSCIKYYVTNPPDHCTANVWKDIELRIYPNPFCTSDRISSMNKKSRSKNPLKNKNTLQVGF